MYKVYYWVPYEGPEEEVYFHLKDNAQKYLDQKILQATKYELQLGSWNMEELEFED